MNSLKRFLILFTFFISSISFSQGWNHIGTPGSISTASEMDFVIAATGDMYVFYKDLISSQGSVKTWDGTSWQLVGPANFTGGLATDYKIEAMSDGTPVISWKTTSGVDRIRIFAWIGSIWVEYGNQTLASDVSRPYDLSVDENDGVSVAYFNLNSAVGSTNEFIWLDISTSGQAQAGNDLSQYINNSISIAKSGSALGYWEMHGEYDISIYTQLNKMASPTFTFDPVTGGAIHPSEGILASEAEVRYVNGSEKFVSIWKEDNNLGGNPLYMRYYDDATNAYSAALYISANVIASDFAVASDGYAYTMDEHATYGMTRVDLSTMTPNTYAVDFVPGTPTIDNPKIDTENGIIVVAWINQSTNEIEVYEEDNPATISLSPNITTCSGGNYAVSGPNFTINDNNYDHSYLSFNVVSDNDAVINSGSVVVAGSYPNYTVQFSFNGINGG